MTKNWKLFLLVGSMAGVIAMNSADANKRSVANKGQPYSRNDVVEGDIKVKRIRGFGEIRVTTVRTEAAYAPIQITYVGVTCEKKQTLVFLSDLDDPINLCDYEKTKIQTSGGKTYVTLEFKTMNSETSRCTEPQTRFFDVTTYCPF